jgi:hypothetical protein
LIVAALFAVMTGAVDQSVMDQLAVMDMVAVAIVDTVVAAVMDTIIINPVKV